MKATHDKLTALTINYEHNKIEYKTNQYQVGYICFTNRIALNTILKALASYALARGKCAYEDVLIDRIFEVEEKCSKQLITTFSFNAQEI